MKCERLRRPRRRSRRDKAIRALRRTVAAVDESTGIAHRPAPRPVRKRASRMRARSRLPTACRSAEMPLASSPSRTARSARMWGLLIGEHPRRN